MSEPDRHALDGRRIPPLVDDAVAHYCAFDDADYHIVTLGYGVSDVRVVLLVRRPGDTLSYETLTVFLDAEVDPTRYPGIRRVLPQRRVAIPDTVCLPDGHAPARPLTPQEEVIRAVLTERGRQDAKWGADRERSHDEWLRTLIEEAGEAAEAIEEHRETGDHSVFTEVIQAAAGAVAWCENIVRRRATGDEGATTSPHNATSALRAEVAYLARTVAAYYRLKGRLGEPPLDGWLEVEVKTATDRIAALPSLASGGADLRAENRRLQALINEYVEAERRWAVIVATGYADAHESAVTEATRERYRCATVALRQAVTSEQAR